MALLLLSAGCRRDGVSRLPVHGTVKTVAGETLDASITFLPADGKKRPAASVGVAKGEYRFDRANGPTAGRTEVHIRRIVARTSIPRSPSKSKPSAPMKKLEWTQVVDIADDGKYQQDFILED